MLNSVVFTIVFTIKQWRETLVNYLHRVLANYHLFLIKKKPNITSTETLQNHLN
nr:MAG TPA: hypothetical protein [Caudoviricetes sp.]